MNGFVVFICKVQLKHTIDNAIAIIKYIKHPKAQTCQIIELIKTSRYQRINN